MEGVFSEIHRIVAAIPAGKVATYGQIAAMVGRPRAARTVVWALHNSSARDLPCHRVVAKTGKLAPEHVFGSVEWQYSLLSSEGITFRRDGCIDLQQHQWQPDGFDPDYPL